jgi:hypothetical protein
MLGIGSCHLPGPKFDLFFPGAAHEFSVHQFMPIAMIDLFFPGAAT